MNVSKMLHFAQCTPGENLSLFATNSELREEVQKKVDKLMEPPPVKAPKPLPKPDDAPRKKRGGRRSVELYTEMISVPMPQCHLN